MPEIPLLIVQDATRDSEADGRVSARVRVGGHPARVVLDFSRPPLAEYVEMPALLDLHPPTAHAVVDFLERVVRGESFDFPVDLSGEVDTAGGPSPFAPLPAERRAELDRRAGALSIEDVRREHDTPEPGQVTLELSLDGRRVRIVAEVDAGPDRVSVVRWLVGPEHPAPESFSPIERYAIDRLLVGRSERA